LRYGLPDGICDAGQPIYLTGNVKNALFVTFSPVDERASLIKQRGAILAFSNFQVPKSTNRAPPDCW
jgi:hypothetical protein